MVFVVFSGGCLTKARVFSGTKATCRVFSGFNTGFLYVYTCFLRWGLVVRIVVCGSFYQRCSCLGMIRPPFCSFSFFTGVPEFCSGGTKKRMDGNKIRSTKCFLLASRLSDKDFFWQAGCLCTMQTIFVSNTLGVLVLLLKGGLKDDDVLKKLDVFDQQSDVLLSKLDFPCVVQDVCTSQYLL